MSFGEFSLYLAGLDSETPLGRVVAVRSEDDPKRIKEMTPDQKRVRNEYRRRSVAKKTPEEIKAMYAQLQTAVKGMIDGKR